MRKIILLLAVLLVAIPAVLSLRGALGSANAIITVEVSKLEPTIVDRTITVYNQNNETIKIMIFPDGGLENITKLLQNNFTLLPNESRDVGYQFIISEPGRYEGALRVAFAPAERKGAGVGLDGSFKIFAISKNETINNQIEDNNDDDNKNISGTLSDENKSSIWVGTIVVASIVLIGTGIFYGIGKWRSK